MSQQLGKLPATPPKVTLKQKQHAPASAQLDNVMRITTPENISFQYEVVGPFRRLFAYLLDLLIVIGAFVAAYFLLALLVGFVIAPLAAAVGLSGALQALMGLVGGFVFVLWFIAYWFYGAYWETCFNGRTLGKRIAGMRVISVDGHAIDGVQATLRNFFRLVDLFPFVPLGALLEIEDIPTQIAIPTYLFGLIVMSLNGRYQRLGDLVANTVVVAEARKLRPDLEMFDDQRVPQLAELIPDSFFVPPSMARTIADYTDNRRRLNYQRASEIASYLGVPLLSRFGLPADTDHDLFLCALYYKIFMNQRDEDEDEWLPASLRRSTPTENSTSSATEESTTDGESAVQANSLQGVEQA